MQLLQQGFGSKLETSLQGMNKINAQGYSNHVFISHRHHTCYYMPAYIRIKCKNLNQMDIHNLNGQINVVLLITIHYGDVSEEVRQQAIKGIVLAFSQGQTLYLAQSIDISFSHKPKDKIFTYTIRKKIKTQLQCDVFWTPFEIIRFLIIIRIRTISFVNHMNKTIDIKFNFMDHQNKFLKASYSNEGTYGVYDLAQSLIEVKYCCDATVRKKQQRKFAVQKMKSVGDDSEISPLKKKPIKSFQCAQFIIPVYKLPMVTLATIFFPLFVLAIINLGVFFQLSTTGKRMLNIGTLMISYIALVPTVRKELPPTPVITLIQILVFLEASTSILSMLQTIDGRRIINIEQDWKNDGYFILSVIISGLIFSIVFILIILHKFVWQPSYNRIQEPSESIFFNRKQWFNQQCDKYFHEMQQQIQPLQKSIN